MTERKIKRALISVYDKTGIVEFAKALVEEFGIEIISTGGTATLLKENGIPVTLVEQITGFPEMLDGRVKTLHPKIHAAILADRDNPKHMQQLKEQGIEPIDMVVVNLYPFEKTVAGPNCTFEQAIEMIDIGGPCLLRAAAKNHKHVCTLGAPTQYSSTLKILRQNRGVYDAGSRLGLANGVFWGTEEYDAAIAAWMNKQPNGSAVATRSLRFVSFGPLRYGENPHQSGESASFLTGRPSDLTIAGADIDNNPPCSFNNLVDACAALEVCAELSRAADLACGTGFQPVECGTGFQPVHNQSTESRTLDHLAADRYSRRNLPHFQTPGRTYFVTFRLQEHDQLTPKERDVVLAACLFWHQKKVDLHAVVVMPDHVHLLMTPKELASGVWASLGELLHSIKRHSAREINKLRGSAGALWQDESFDRIVRSEQELAETFDYMANNPIKAGLTERLDYPWFWHEIMGVDRGETDGTAGLKEEIKAASKATAQSGAPVTNRCHTQSPVENRCHTESPVENRCHTAICAFIKHTNPCGVGVAASPLDAYSRAYLGDPNAAMGGILACNFDIDGDVATAVMDTYDRLGRVGGVGGFFVEVWVAPRFAGEAVQIIRTRKKWGERVRMLSVGDMTVPPEQEDREYRSITGGMLVQTRDLVGLNEDQWKVVTKRKPSESEISDLRLAWLVAKHTKSNAISLCKDGMLIGNGAGQMSRVMSCRIATWLANENGHAEKLKGSVAASDAFFPFADGPNILMDAGVTAIIQPGGSKRDEEVIAACDARDVAMIFTGTRHFKH